MTPAIRRLSILAVPAILACVVVGIGLRSRKQEGEVPVSVQEPRETEDVVLHLAEAATVPSPFRLENDAKAAGGVALTVPPKSGEASAEIEMQVELAREGLYTVWVRAFWGTDGEDACSNSILVGLDDLPPVLVQDATYQAWHWLPVRLAGGRDVPVQLEAGVHRLRILSREDGIKLDQVFITPWRKDEFERRVPQGIEQ